MIETTIDPKEAKILEIIKAYDDSIGILVLTPHGKVGRTFKKKGSKGTIKGMLQVHLVEGEPEGNLLHFQKTYVSYKPKQLQILRFISDEEVKVD
jgi:hypothetical protein